jgi:DnaJ-class molecular chaperone
MSTPNFSSIAEFSATESAYDILNVDPTCTAGELKASYKRLILLHHPDKAVGMTDLFLKVQAAWRLVSTEDDRKRYDMTSNSGVFVSSESYTLSEFTVCGNGDAFSRPCRCGDSYQVCSSRICTQVYSKLNFKCHLALFSVTNFLKEWYL